MDIDDLINEPEGETPHDPVNEQYKNRLAVIISGGQSQRYLGKLVTIAHLEEMEADQVDQLHAVYEAKLGSEIVTPLKDYGRKAYAWVAGKLVSRYSTLLLNEDSLIKDFEKNQSIDNAITGLVCKIHHRYGMFLTPIMVILTTAMNVEPNNNLNTEFNEVHIDGAKSD